MKQVLLRLQSGADIIKKSQTAALMQISRSFFVLLQDNKKDGFQQYGTRL